ncbi:hypothetical protein T492DRAFT_866809 [Pavlovales sp. CCMP2436]|nr:hypothetical protein T492DRAFT_866809 [Pavlovales sp. CCMP2436]
MQRKYYYYFGFAAVGVGVSWLLSLDAGVPAAEPGPEPDATGDLLLVDNGELAAVEGPPSLAAQIAAMLKTLVPQAAGAIGVEGALVLGSKGLGKGLTPVVGKAVGSSIAKVGGGLAALGLVGDLSELANGQLRGQAEELIKLAAHNRQLEEYVARQEELERAAGDIYSYIQTYTSPRTAALAESDDIEI